jgi:hypothetical protein
MLHVHVPCLRAACVPATANVDHACQHAGTCLNQCCGQGGHVQAGQASHLEKTVSNQISGTQGKGKARSSMFLVGVQSSKLIYATLQL